MQDFCSVGFCIYSWLTQGECKPHLAHLPTMDEHSSHSSASNWQTDRLIGGTDDVKHLIQGWSSWQTQMMQCALGLQPSQGSPSHSENGLSPLALMSEFASCFYMKEWETISPFCPLWKMNRLIRHKGDDQGFSLGHVVLIWKEAGSNEQRRWATSCFYLKQCETLSPICSAWNMSRLAPVSYTHLTLPTSVYV